MGTQLVLRTDEPLPIGSRSIAAEDHFFRRRDLGGNGMGKGSMQWLADELVKVAFQPGTDPVVRDYIMQHLGHLWEKDGARKEIDAALWRAVETQDETTPGTAWIALSRGYARDQDKKSQAAVHERALALAADPDTPLAVRVTVLAIAGDGGGNEVKKLANRLIQNSDTPLILRKVAERLVREKS